MTSWPHQRQGRKKLFGAACADQAVEQGANPVEAVPSNPVLGMPCNLMQRTKATSQLARGQAWANPGGQDGGDAGSTGDPWCKRSAGMRVGVSFFSALDSSNRPDRGCAPRAETCPTVAQECRGNTGREAIPGRMGKSGRRCCGVDNSAQSRERPV